MRYNKSFPLSTNGFIENLQEDYRRIFYSSYEGYFTLPMVI